MWFVNRPWSPPKGCHIQGVPGTDTAETDGWGRTCPCSGEGTLA